MYERYFGFTERPFELTANPRYLFLTERYREALGTLTYGLSSHKGIVVMTGEAGTGKTTMLNAALAGARHDQLVAYLSNPTLRRAEFIEIMTTQLGLPAEVATSKARFLQAVTRLLEDRAAAGKVTALVIDEAHSLPTRLLEEVRLLANIEQPERKLLTVVLVGQPELADRLSDPSLRQLKQRIALRCALVPLTLRESAAYIAKRIGMAGGNAQVFTRDAVLAIYEHSGGIPRTINVICENALVSAYARDESTISHQLVAEVARDFDFHPAAEPVEPSASVSDAGAASPRVLSVPAPWQRPPEASPVIGSVSGSPPSVGGVQPTAVASVGRRRSFWRVLQFWKR